MCCYAWLFMVLFLNMGAQNLYSCPHACARNTLLSQPLATLFCNFIRQHLIDKTEPEIHFIVEGDFELQISLRCCD